MRKILNWFREKISNIKAKILNAFNNFKANIELTKTIVLSATPLVLASTTDDMMQVVTDWMPIILMFAILGMIFGMMRRLQKAS